MATDAHAGELPLRGRGIVVTRPANQAQALARRIAAAGGTPILFPAIDIRPAASAAVREMLSHLDRYDLAIFVSGNAVACGLALRGATTWPQSVLAAAVGRGTARALRAHGVARVLVPAGREDSEGLLALPELAAVTGRRILIVRGVGGRDLIADTLRVRGATVEFAECYERNRPGGDARVLTDAWAHGVLDAITITSSEGLRNLHALLDREDAQRLQRTPVFVTHQRIAESARALGIDDVIVAGAGDDGLIEALERRFAHG